LPNYEIILLNYNTIKDWLDEDDYNLLINNKDSYSLPQIADILRCMILNKHGGLWLDCDTIITKSIKDIENVKRDTELLMIRRHLAFIFASRGSKIIGEWHRGVLDKIKIKEYEWSKNRKFKKIIVNLKILCCMFKIFLCTVFLKKGKIQKYKDKIFAVKNCIGRWNCVGNSILSPILHQHLENQKETIDLTTVMKYENFFPEKKNVQIKKSKDIKDDYVNFYFKNNNDDAVEGVVKDSTIICLHNSWTPNKYKLMNEGEFLEQNITLVKILRRLLK
jgi:hypothetical protein